MNVDADGDSNSKEDTDVDTDGSTSEGDMDVETNESTDVVGDMDVKNDNDNNEEEATEAVASSGATKTLVICTDSMYTINCVSVWHYKWANSGWVNSQGQQVNNQDLIRGILDRMKAYRGSIQFIHVRGHSGIHGNEQADLLAVRGANTIDLH
ncbi:hypothetical protein LPJ60_002019 [Coemansia sp. RSA 2675]|nr:hypothetical protein LPJ60_002019 [Coemansia sp. RSA 2675]